MVSKHLAGIPLILCLAALQAEGADATRFQLVPQVGYRAGGSLEDSQTGDDRNLDEAGSLGAAVEWRVRNEDRWWQLWYSRQGSAVTLPDGGVDVDVEYLHIGGTAPISDEGRFTSFISGGLGATRLSPSGAGLDDATKFSASLGLGLSMPVSERVSLRLEARGYLTFVDSDTAIFCRSDFGDGACRIVATGSTLFQAELNVGIAFGF